MPVAVNPVRREEKRDPLETIMKGLNIANQLYGMKVNSEKLDMMRQQNQAQQAATQRAQSGQITPDEELGLMKDFERVERGSADEDGAISRTLVNPSDGTTETVLLKKRQDPNSVLAAAIKGQQVKGQTFLNQPLSPQEIQTYKRFGVDVPATMTRGQAQQAFGDPASYARSQALDPLEREKLSRIRDQPKLTEAEKTVDKKYGAHYNEYTGGGREKALASIEKLEKIQKELAEDPEGEKGGGGRLGPIVPDVLRSRKSIEWRTDAQNAANATLKELFGGALSDAERKAAAEEYYNDALDNKNNAARLAQKIKELKSKVRVEDKKANYYQDNRTLKGFKFPNKSLSPEDQEALDWARKNPNDPDAIEILRLNGETQ